MSRAEPRLSVRRQAVLATAALIVFLVAMTVVVVSFLPVVTSAEQRLPSGQWSTFEMPLMEFHPQLRSTDVRFTLFLPAGFASDTYVVRYRDELSSLRVNGASVARSTGALVRLGAYLHAGDNHVEATVLLTDEPAVLVFGFGPSVWYPPLLIGIILTILALGAWLLFLRRCGYFPLPRSVAWVAMLGIVLRVLYAFCTPVYVRSYDWRGHLQYIFYLLDRHAFPHANELWQGHQAPLFYVLELPLAFLGRALGWDTPEISILLQILPLLLSVATLLVGIRIVLRTFPTTASRIVGSLLLAAFPALIYFSSQVNNDVLLTFIGFLWFERLVHAAKTGERRDWLTAGLFCGLGLLAKANAAPWVAVTILVAFLSRKRRSDRIRDALTVAGSAFAVGGWWYVMQSVLLRERFSVVANAFYQVGLVKLHPVVSEFLTFNPVELIRHPSVSVADIVTRPQFFLETIFRTSQLGSLYFSDDANILIVFALLLTAWMLVGAYAECRERKFVNIATIVILFLAAAFFRLKYPFATSEHFRYVAVTAVPFVLLTVRGISVTRNHLLRILGEMTAVVYAVFVSILILSVLAFS